MAGRTLTAAAAAVSLAEALAFWAPARSDEDPWSEAAVRARFPDPDAATKPDQFAGNAECKECHEDRVKSLAASAHAKFVDAKKSASRGCQECHGPGADHVDDPDKAIRNPNLTADLDAPTDAPATKQAGGDAKPPERGVVPV